MNRISRTRFSKQIIQKEFSWTSFP